MALGYKSGDEDLTLDQPEWTETVIQKRTRERLDKGADIAAQVLNGVWDWGDEKVPRHRDGTYRCPKNWLIEQMGWRDSDSARARLHTTYWRDALARSMHRFDKGYSQELGFITKEGALPAALSQLTYDSLIADLSDPDRAQRISFRDRVALWKASTEMAAKVEGDTRTKGGMNLTRSVQALIDERGQSVKMSQVEVKLTPAELTHPPIENVDVDCEEE